MIPEFDHTAPYIWAAFALSAIVLAGLTAGVLVKASAAQRRLDAAEQDEARDA